MERFYKQGRISDVGKDKQLGCGDVIQVNALSLLYMNIN